MLQIKNEVTALNCNGWLVYIWVYWLMQNRGFTEILVLEVDFHIRICKLRNDCRIETDIRNFSTKAVVLFWRHIYTFYEGPILANF